MSGPLRHLRSPAVWFGAIAGLATFAAIYNYDAVVDMLRRYGFEPRQIFDLALAASFLTFILRRLYEAMRFVLNGSLWEGRLSGEQSGESESTTILVILQLLGLTSGAFAILLLAHAVSFVFPTIVAEALDRCFQAVRFVVSPLQALTAPIDKVKEPFDGWWLATVFMLLTTVAGWFQAVRAKQAYSRELAQFVVITGVTGGLGYMSSPEGPISAAVFWTTLGAFVQLLLKGLFDRFDPRTDAESVVGRYVLNMVAVTGLLLVAIIAWKVLAQGSTG